MDFSARIRKEAQKHNVPPQTLVMADLMAVGYTANEAYAIAYHENAGRDKQWNIRIRDGILNSVEFRDLMERNNMPLPTTSNGEGLPQFTKDEIATQLRRQIEQLPDGSKEKADVLMKYADLFAYKKEEKKAEDEDVIRVWIPLTCDICPYKNKTP